MILAAGLCGVDFADGVAGLGIGGSGYGASVDDDDVGGGGSVGDGVALGAELALDGGGVGLRGAAAELFDVEGGMLEHDSWCGSEREGLKAGQSGAQRAAPLHGTRDVDGLTGMHRANSG